MKHEKYFINYLLYYFTSFFFERNCAKTKATKLIICNKFFKNSLLTNNKFGRCSLFPKEEKRDINYYVSGMEKNIDFHFCSTARTYDDMCGKDGKKYINLSEDRLKCKKK